MTSNINVSGIDTTFPKQGKNNNTNIMRNNWSRITSNFDVAHDEITALQNQMGAVTSNLTLTLAGDVTSPITVLPGGVTMTTSLKSRGLGNQTYNSATQDINLSVNDAGVVTALKVINPTSTDNTKYSITPTIVQTLKGQGISQIVFPEFTVSPNGKILSSDNVTVKFGLSGLALSSGSAIVGNSNGLSDVVTPTADNQALMYKNGTTSFQNLSITDFSDIDFTGAINGQVLTYNGTKWIPENPVTGGSFNPSTIPNVTTMNSSMSFVMLGKDAGNNSLLESINATTMLSYIYSNMKIKIVRDTSPQLGGTLDLNGNGIIASNDASISIGGNLFLSSGSNININSGSSTSLIMTGYTTNISTPILNILSGKTNVSVSNDGISIHSGLSMTGNLTVNGITYPQKAATDKNMFLSCDSTGSTTWKVPDLVQMIEKVGVVGDVVKNTKLLSFNPDSQQVNLIPTEEIVGFFNGKFYISDVNGNDAIADGSITSPYKTLEALLSYITNTGISYDEVDIILDSGKYDIVSIPKNIKSLSISAYNKILTPTISSLQNCNVAVSNLFCSGITFAMDVTFTIGYGTFYQCGFSGVHSYTFIGNSSDNTSNTLNINSCWFSTYGAGGITFASFPYVFVKDCSDVYRVSTVYLGTQSITNDKSQYNFTNCGIGNMNVYSGNTYFHACEFFNTFKSYIVIPDYYSTVTNCSFLNYSTYPGSSSVANIQFDPKSLIMFDGNTSSIPFNVDFSKNQTFNSYMINQISPLRYDLRGSSNNNNQVIRLSSDVVVVKLLKQNIVNSGGVVDLFIMYIAGRTFNCRLIITVDGGAPAGSKINLWNMKPLNKSTSDTSILSVDDNATNSSFFNFSRYKIVADLSQVADAGQSNSFRRSMNTLKSVLSAESSVETKIS